MRRMRRGRVRACGVPDGASARGPRRGVRPSRARVRAEFLCVEKQDETRGECGRIQFYPALVVSFPLLLTYRASALQVYRLSLESAWAQLSTDMLCVSQRLHLYCDDTVGNAMQSASRARPERAAAPGSNPSRFY